MSSLDTKKQITISYNFIEKQSMSRNLHLNYYLEKREKDTQNLKKQLTSIHCFSFIL